MRRMIAVVWMLSLSLTSAALAEAPLGATRQPLGGDVFLYQFLVRVGHAPNAVLRVSRVVRETRPWAPRPTHHAVMLLHGDFATFVTNFAPTAGTPASPAPGLAPYLARAGVDVWGVD